MPKLSTCRYFVTRIAGESAAQFQKRREEDLAEAELKFPRAEKRAEPNGFSMYYKGDFVAYFADK